MTTPDVGDGDLDELVIAVAAARLSVEFESTHPHVAARANRLMKTVLDRHGVTASEAVEIVLSD